MNGFIRRCATLPDHMLKAGIENRTIRAHEVDRMIKQMEDQKALLMEEAKRMRIILSDRKAFGTEILTPCQGKGSE